MRRGIGAIAVVAAAFVRPPLADAQTDTAAPPVAARNACLDAIPDSALRPVPVYLTTTFSDSTLSDTPIGAGILQLGVAVAQAARALLGPTDTGLPGGEPTVDWRSLAGRVTVVAHRDGRIDAHVTPPRDAEPAFWTHDAGLRLIERALDTAYARGERLRFPDGTSLDSVSWRFRLEPSVLDERGAVMPPKMRLGTPIFSVSVPPQRPVSAERVRVRYPDHLRRNGFMGNVRMEFVVDTTGRVDEATIRDVYPRAGPALAGAEQSAYTAFRRAIREGLLRARYRPARVGGCLVRQRVAQPFSFLLDDGRQPAP